MSMFPFQGNSLSGWCASSTMMSTKMPPGSSWWAFVVVKYMFPGTYCPGLMSTSLWMCSAARPWCAGRMY